MRKLARFVHYENYVVRTEQLSNQIICASKAINSFSVRENATPLRWTLAKKFHTSLYTVDEKSRCNNFLQKYACSTLKNIYFKFAIPSPVHSNSYFNLPYPPLYDSHCNIASSNIYTENGLLIDRNLFRGYKRRLNGRSNTFIRSSLSPFTYSKKKGFKLPRNQKHISLRASA